MAFHIKIAKLPSPVREHVFHPTRKWRFDFAWPEARLALEVEGGAGKGASRHTSPAGFEQDCEKYNAALLLGWRVLRVTSRQVNKGVALSLVESALSTSTGSPRR